jgi:pimeloyl-ACP methyl ester carboxylesterase
VWGREDTWIPLDRATRLRALIPDSTLRLIDNAGHLVQEDQPAALTTEIYRWITRQSNDPPR